MRLVVTSLVALAAAVGGCHPLAVFHPADLPRDRPLVFASTDAWPRAAVEIHVDGLGIPHIYGESEPDLAYALGVMHARDRLFQIYLYAHAGAGRLTEILGRDLLEIDRENRLLMHGADELIAALAPRDREIVAAYCAGVNAGARAVGRSAEMAILGVEWEPIGPMDVIAIARLQQWDQSVGFAEEMARHRLVKALGRESPVALALLQDSPSGGVPVVSAAEHDGARPEPAPGAADEEPPLPPEQPSADGPEARAPQRALARDSLHVLHGLHVPHVLHGELAARFAGRARGASNSWSVAPAKTAAGVAVLANDPHLTHSAPGIFYLVDLHLQPRRGAEGEREERILAGGTFPGIPTVLIGHGRHIAWGVTNAFADTQDIVVLEPVGAGAYLLDGEAVPFGAVTQRFRLGKAKDAEVVEETWQTSLFGPVLPPRYGSSGGRRPLVDEGERLALLWTAQQFPEGSARMVSSFWSLAAARNVEEASAALQDFSAPAMSVNMAFTDGTIAYRLSGIVPVRGDAQRVDRPRRGTTRAAGWIGRLPAAEKPQMTNPDKGFIIASNQRVVENDVLTQRSVGFEAARPWRALRIDERLQAALAAGKPSTEEILSIQQDIVGIDAREAAPILGAHCPAKVEGHDDRRVQAFCAAIAGFDGAYSIDALATPFARTARALALEIFRAHVDEDLALSLASESFSTMALHEIVKAEHAGARSPVLDDPRTEGREGLDGFMARATKSALELVVAEAGGGESDWRWGKLHKLSLRGALAGAPVIGGLFQTSEREEAGSGSAPRAESVDFDKGLRVRSGAGLRLVAEMTDPPAVRMINDSGNSGHFGHRHLEDQADAWSRGAPRILSFRRGDPAAREDGAMIIEPRR
jgi:penicillin G amidase